MSEKVLKKADVFQKAGRRSTAQRRLVLDVLSKCHGHLDAEAVHDRVKERDPRVSLATVYRSLSILKEMGLVARHSLGEEHAHFETVHGGPHFHFTCAGCGGVSEFQSPETVQVARKIGIMKGFTIKDIHLSLSGYCKKCRERLKAEKQGDAGTLLEK